MAEKKENRVREYPEILMIFADHVAKYLIKKGFSDQKSNMIGLEVAEEIRKNLGGECVYIPKRRSLENSKRDKEIFQDFGTMSVWELQQKYELSQRRIYQIISSVKYGKQ